MPAVDYALLERFLTETVKNMRDDKFYPKAILINCRNKR